MYICTYRLDVFCCQMFNRPQIFGPTRCLYCTTSSVLFLVNVQRKSLRWSSVKTRKRKKTGATCSRKMMIDRAGTLLHVRCVSVFTCVCLCLYILLWSICSGFIWITTFSFFFLWPFFSISQKARSRSNEGLILIQLPGTRKESL